MRRFALAIATVGPVGYAPVASGTAGSLVALPFLPSLAVLRDGSALGYAALVVALVVLAVWAAGEAERAIGGHDHSTIVIDEVAGMVLSGAFLPPTWLAAGVAFVFFRVFDVWKPFPASVFDARVRGGLGVVGDDLVAGVYAGLGTRLVLRFL